jgi:hypothetical protein
MDIYKQAVFLGLTFPSTKGDLIVTDVVKLKRDFIVEMLKSLYSKLQENTTNIPSFLVKSTKLTKEQELLQLRYDVLLDIYNTKVSEEEKQVLTKAAKEHNAAIAELIANKRKAELAELSIEQLEQLIKHV